MKGRPTSPVARLLSVLALVALILAVWSLWWEPRRLLVREETMRLPCWTGGPLQLAVISDLHVGSPGTTTTKVDRLVDIINMAKPDAVLLLGDFVIQGVVGGRFVPPERIAERLGRLQAPLGVHAVLGNHDWWFDGPRIQEAFRAAGVRVLEDDAILVQGRTRAFWLAGISDFWEGRHDVTATMAKVSGDAPVIAMTHNPDVFPSIPARVCLTLAGHTHGGQVRLPLLGAPVVPSRFGQRYAAGHIIEEGKHLFVTSGVGTSIFPVRFRVPPEVLLLRLQ